MSASDSTATTNIKQHNITSCHKKLEITISENIDLKEMKNISDVFSICRNQQKSILAHALQEASEYEYSFSSDEDESLYW